MAKYTALITGASSGLGEQFAHLFAKDGHDVVLVARGKQRLEEIAKKLIEAHKINAHVIAADLSDSASPQNIYDECKTKGLQVDHLVNNAGFGTNGAYLDVELEKEIDEVEVNIEALMRMTHLFARPMRERKFGRVLNIGSTAGFQPGPFMSTYYASKAFVIFFSEGLAYELRGTGVTVTCHCPGATRTEFSMRAGNDKSRLFQRGSGVASASDVALHAYKAMMRGDVLAIHGALNAMGVMSVRFSPRAWVRAIAARLNSPS